jgi:hypothetical protein
MTLGLPVPADQLLNIGSTITIEELTASVPGGKPRRIVLVGGALPFMGQADWGGDTKIVTTWYPGNGTEASQQNLGPQEMPSTWTGEWNRTRMGRAPSFFFDQNGSLQKVIDPHLLWGYLDAIRIAGGRLRVTWAVRGNQLLGSSKTGTNQDVDFAIVREGRIKSLKISPDRLTDFKWSMELHWMSRGGRQDRVADVRRDDNVSLAVTAVSDSINALGDLLAQRTQGIIDNLGKHLGQVGHLSLGQLEAIAAAPLKAVNAMMSKLRYNLNQLARIGNLAKKIATTPAAVANNVIDFARDTVSVSHNFLDSMSRTPFELQANKSKVSDLIRSAKYFGQISDQVQTAAKQGSDLDIRMRQALVAGANRGSLSTKDTPKQGDILAIHVCKESDTPQRVSSQYYGNPDQGEAILRANRMPLYTPTLRPGLIIIIPVLVNAPRT